MPSSSRRTTEIKREVRSTFDFISYDYDKLRSRIWEDLAQFTIESLFTPKPTKDMLFMDLACGNARHAIYFGGRYGLRVVAIDFSVQLLRLARSKARQSGMERNLAIIDADASSIPLRDLSIDGVLYIAAVHHLPSASERLKSLQEISRVARSKGRAVVTVWRKWQRRFTPYFIKEHLRFPLANRVEGEIGDICVPWRSGHGAASVARFYHLFTKREMKQLLSRAGFKIVRITKSSKRAGEGSFFACIEKREVSGSDI